MATILNRQTTFATNGTVTAAGLHNLIDDTQVYAAIINSQTELTSAGTSDKLLIADFNLPDTSAPKYITIHNLLDDGLSAGVYTSASFTSKVTSGSLVGPLNGNVTGNLTGNVTGNINSTYSTFGSSTTGTTFSTAGSTTNGTIQTLTASTATISVGTYSGAINSTNGTIANLRSTTGTIGNFTTTLAGDFTISSGTGTLATSGATSGTYGDASSYPIVAVNAKGIVTSVSTAAGGGSIGTNSVYFGSLSTSATESTNVASRVAKAWVNFNGNPTLAVRNSFNINQVVRNNTGDYTVNFNTSIGTGMAFSVDGNGATFNYVINAEITTASSIRIYSSDTGAIKTDLAYISVVAFGS